MMRVTRAEPTVPRFMQPAAAVPMTKAIDLQPSASVQLTLIPAAGTSWIHRTRPNTRRGKQLGGNSYGIKVKGRDLRKETFDVVDII